MCPVENAGDCIFEILKSKNFLADQMPPDPPRFSFCVYIFKISHYSPAVRNKSRYKMACNHSRPQPFASQAVHTWPSFPQCQFYSFGFKLVFAQVFLEVWKCSPIQIKTLNYQNEWKRISRTFKALYNDSKHSWVFQDAYKSCNKWYLFNEKNCCLKYNT